MSIDPTAPAQTNTASHLCSYEGNGTLPRLRVLRQLIFLGAVIPLPVSTAWAVPPAQLTAAQLTGVYSGNYRCAQGAIELTLTVRASGNGSVTGEFMFTLPANSNPNTASYSLKGTFNADAATFHLDPVKWNPPVPSGYIMIGLDGTFDPRNNRVMGKITGGAGRCTTFTATRNTAKSIAMLNPGAPATPAPESAVTKVATPPASAANSRPPRPSPAPAPAPAPVAAIAPPVPAATDPPPDDPRLATLTPRDRQLFVGEFPRSQQFCQNSTMSQTYDCTCFARSVLDYRITHTDEKIWSHRIRAGVRDDSYDYASVVGILPKIDMRKCPVEEKVYKYVDGLSRYSNSSAWKYLACLQPATLNGMRTHTDMTYPNYSEALKICIK